VGDRADRLTIAIDTLAVGDRQWGSRRQLQSIIPALGRRGADEDFVVLVSRHNRHLFEAAADAPNITLHEIRLRSDSPVERALVDQLVVPRHAGRLADVLFMPADVGAIRSPVPVVVNVWSHLAVPRVRTANPKAADSGQASRLRDLYHRTLMGAGLRRADAVISISGYLADQVGLQWGVDVRPVLLGVDPVPGAPMGGREPLVLFVSTLYPYKNVRQLLAAHAELVSKVPDARVVVIGADPDGRQLAELRRITDELGTSTAVELRGAVDDVELEQFYGRARCLVLTSFGEGFGLPVVEAMAHGLPVIVSDRLALPEVAGDGGIVVDPDDPSALARALELLLLDHGHAERIGAAAAARAAALSWDAAADAHLEVFRAVATDRR
jgi:glycosyltransferase involved in cell wall biosynthesis